MSRIAVYLDQDVDVELAVRLRASGYDVVTTRDISNIGKSDEEQLQYAADQGRAILTHNRRHFRRLHRDWTSSGRQHSGIIVSRHLPIDELERRTLNLLQSTSVQEARGHLLSLADFI